MAQRILSISYDELLLITRQLLLEDAGFKVTSALGFVSGLQECSAGKFDLVIIGHSIPRTEKQSLLQAVRHNCDAPVLLLCKPTEDALLDVDYSIDSIEPDSVLKAVRQILKSGRKRAA
jgi:DNA-binding response OmpR family regulator